MREHDQYTEFESDFDHADDLKWHAKKAKKAQARTDGDVEPGRRGRLTEEAKDRLAQMREDAVAADVPEDGDRWSTWGDADQGPKPHPRWLVTDLSAVDRELGIVKTGKEADVFLLERAMPGTDRSCLLAAKRYRSNDHRLFHRDAGYLEGRRMRRSREMRAMTNRSAFGRNLIAERWAVAEFAALAKLWQMGAPVPYPVQRDGTELLLEFVGADGAAAPRLAQLRPEPDELLDLWRQLVDALGVMASAGLGHGDLSAFNLMVHDGRLVVIDLPQVVDLVANPRGPEFLERDVRNVAGWFTARGLPPELAEPREVTGMLLDLAGLR
ncbi:serine protein kinase RIO [Saccharothrix texasensis]|uniref:non-specific serine/threonine protein kinase n=1 Tax=Saccharothrix texasensis TaxID=103734 RepID=A0A3N1HES0_9PSEU|nr:RIO1 family regulatory kinase/ATPase [Saccharothrix texasensis]ROP40782.1 RIO kinase 1 [Saccharothrix texasensis]